MSVILTAANNVSAVSRGRYEPNFTMNVRDLDTRNKTLNLDSAQFELHFENVQEKDNKLYIVHGQQTDRLAIITGNYSYIEDLIDVINETLKKAGHEDISFSYARRSARVTISVPESKVCLLKKDSPGVVLGVGEIAKEFEIKGTRTLPFAVDLSKGRRLVLLYTDLIGPSIQYEDNTDSRVVKTFLVQNMNGINNYVFAKEDKRLLLAHENVREISFWLKFNTGELITSGYPIYLSFRLENISP